jgi:sec-independent protein translocase protein TatB
MLEIGWGKIVLIGIVALLVIGPKELPTVLRTVGQWTAKLRRMAAEFQTQFQEAMREAEMTDLRKQVEEMAGQAQSYADFDPVGEVRKELDSAQQQIEGAIAGTPAVDASSSPAAPQQTQDAPPGAGSEPTVAPATPAGAMAPSPGTSESEPIGSDAAKHDAQGKPV